MQKCYIDCDLIYSFFLYSICNPLIFIVRKESLKIRSVLKTIPTYLLSLKLTGRNTGNKDVGILRMA